MIHPRAIDAALSGRNPVSDGERMTAMSSTIGPLLLIAFVCLCLLILVVAPLFLEWVLDAPPHAADRDAPAALPRTPQEER